MSPVVPKPAASVLLVRPAEPGGSGPFEVYLIRRQKAMKFLGGFYAFPGGRVDEADGSPESLERCRGLAADEAEAVLTGDGQPALAYWIAAVRELVEESGLLILCHADGRPLDLTDATVATAAERLRKGLMGAEAPWAALLAREDWYCDLTPLRYLSHFTTPTASPIRFSARFFLCPLPIGQAPRLFTEEISEGFWIAPAEGYRRFWRGEMAMAEPAEYGLGYLAQFNSLAELWAAHADGRHKFDGIIDRIDAFWKRFDWQRSAWSGPPWGSP